MMITIIEKELLSSIFLFKAILQKIDLILLGYFFLFCFGLF